MVGICMSGIRSTGRRVSEMAPSRMITMLVMNIVTGRSIAMRGIDICVLTELVTLNSRRLTLDCVLLLALRPLARLGTVAATEFLAAGGSELAPARRARPARAIAVHLAGDDELIVIAHRAGAGGDEAIAFLEP